MPVPRAPGVLRIGPPAPSRGSGDIANVFLESGTESHLPEKPLCFQDPKKQRCWRSPDDFVSLKQAVHARTQAHVPTRSASPGQDLPSISKPLGRGSSGHRAASSPRSTSKRLFHNTFAAPLPPDIQDTPRAGSPEAPGIAWQPPGAARLPGSPLHNPAREILRGQTWAFL